MLGLTQPKQLHNLTHVWSLGYKLSCHNQNALVLSRTHMPCDVPFDLKPTLTPSAIQIIKDSCNDGHHYYKPAADNFCQSVFHCQGQLQLT